MRHIHLDPLGGAAGDMFAACLLDAFPAHRPAVIAAAEGLAGVPCAFVAHSDGTLTGGRFEVQAGRSHTHGHLHADHSHAHVAWRDIRQQIERSALGEGVKAHAVGIFAVLAAAEARVHGRDVDAVAFHEVGAADSIADIVAAAALIDAIGPAGWSVGPLPVGGGMIHTAHGPMPVPAPATALLLEGFLLRDDGIGGERVTPTGAAILRYLNCASGRASGGRLSASGFGFGTRVLPGISNCLRALVFEVAETSVPGLHRELAVVAFEVDDQSGEELAAGLERVRATPGVHDVVQMAAFGKKSRLAVHVQVLVAPDALEAAVEACFRETTTIGLRTHLVQGRALRRRFERVEVDGHEVQVKLVERPEGVMTAKAEADDIRGFPTHAARGRIRRDAEMLAVGKVPA
jgi:uncharacterized protein (TIGR00299 family) protein